MKNKKLINIEEAQTLILEVCGESGFGDLVAKPAEEGYKDCKIYIIENKRIKPSLQAGDKFVGEVINKRGTYWTKPVVRTHMAGVEPEKVKGVVTKESGRFILKSTDKLSSKEYRIINPKSASVGDFVSGFLKGSGRYKDFEIVKSFGKFNINKATAELVLEKYEIPFEFSTDTIRETKSFKTFNEKNREDLTSVPFVTIDGEDAKDFDDAVFAEKTLKGFDIMVAIADVAFYVRPHTNLDREAYKRGNSVYLPNMVIPMLPEILSNDLCSLRPKEKRPAIVCSMKIDNAGNILNYDFKRAVIKSVARLNYKEVQNSIEGNFNVNTTSIFKNVIQPIYEAYCAFENARKKRGALELETTEIKVKIDKNGNVSKIEKEEIYTSNKMIEEFMIAANVCAAKALKETKLPVMYRIHDKPSEEKVSEIKPLLKSLGFGILDAPSIKPEHFNKILEVSNEKGYGLGISDLILRLQSQAKYNPTNIGHFGLALDDYVHFTSPIRRYSDLLIHRALIKAYNMEDGGELEDEATEKTFKDIAEYISSTERKAINAERELVSRFLAQYLEPSIGADFEVKISGISSAGVFVRVESLGAEGLIPMRTLPDDDYIISQSNIEMAGQDRSFAIGDKIIARLVESSAFNGSMIFKYVDEEQGVDYFEKKGNNRINVRLKSLNKKIKEKTDKKKTKKTKSGKNKK